MKNEQITTGSNNNGPHGAASHDEPISLDSPRTMRSVSIEQPQSGWSRFWFTPAAPTALHTLRVLSGLVFLFWLLTLVGHQQAFFGLHGWFDARAYQEIARLPMAPTSMFHWSVLYLCGDNGALLGAVYWTSIVVLLLFTAGVATRVTSVLTWVIVVSFMANPALRFGADYLLVLPAFYLMIGYLFYGQWNRPLSWTARLLGSRDAFVGNWFSKSDEQEVPASYAANLALRVFQVHFALIIVVSALHKLQMGEWWGGVALWYSMHLPFTTTLDAVRSSRGTANAYLFFWSLIQYAVLAWQLAFPAFAWRQGWARLVLLGGGLLGWLGLFFIMQLPLFGPVFFLGCLCYLTPREWQTAFNVFRKVGSRPATEELETPRPKMRGKKIKVGV